ncbi:MAG: sugar ABC transporter permease [Trueperaceae bacterium]|nr:sugar ABC transporter permease [Trueperaceae bacterium]
MTRETRSPYLWILPVLVPVFLFTLYPVGYALWTSLHRMQVLLPGEPFVGLANYASVLTTDSVWTAARNTLVFTATSAPLTVAVGLGVAYLLLAHYPGRIYVRSVVLLPWALPGAITAVIWTWVFQPSWGILNLILRSLGIVEENVRWLTRPDLAKVATTVAHVWTQFPFAAVLMLAALAAIDETLYAAAAIDGANAWQRFRFITLPQISTMIAILLIYETLVAITSYDVTYAMTGGGPGSATTLLSFQIWKQSFSELNFGNGAALAFLTALLSLVFIVSILRAIPTEIFGTSDGE